MRRVVFALALVLAGCSIVKFGAVNPKPSSEVPEIAKSYSLEVNRSVQDDQRLDTIEIQQFRATLQNGFQNAAGARYVAAPTEGTCRLVIDSATLATADLGSHGKFLTLNYRARWIASNGTVLAQVVGVARPRDPTETRPRHLEDVVEVMYEQLIEGLSSTDAAPAPVVRSVGGTPTVM